MIKRFLFAVACGIPFSCGCSLTYPLLSRDTKPLIGEPLTVQNSAQLVSADDSKQLEIVIGPIPGNQHKVAELAEGTELRVRSFWRHHRWYPIGGLVTTDYALVTVNAPGDGGVTAKLALAEFNDVFDGSKYRPKPAIENE